MEIEITGHQMVVTPRLKALVEENLAQLEHYYNHIMRAHVVLEVNKVRHIAKGHLFLKGKTINAEAETEDMYKSVDQLAKKLLSEIKKYKDKKQQH